MVGLDFSFSMLMRSREKSAADHFINADAQCPFLPLSDRYFDLTISSGATEYLKNPLNVISEMMRVTRPGGIVATSYIPAENPNTEVLEIDHSGEMESFHWSGKYLEEVFLLLNAETLVHTKRFVGYHQHGEPQIYGIYVCRTPQQPILAAANISPRKGRSTETARNGPDRSDVSQFSPRPSRPGQDRRRSPRQIKPAAGQSS